LYFENESQRVKGKRSIPSANIKPRRIATEAISISRRGRPGPRERAGAGRPRWGPRESKVANLSEHSSEDSSPQTLTPSASNATGPLSQKSLPEFSKYKRVSTLRKAGERLLAEAARPKPRGESPSKLTVDIEIEQDLHAAILARFPDDEIHGEELGPRPGTSGRVWIIDPHDGTSEFSQGARETSISLAIYENGALRLGVVYLPCLALLEPGPLRELLGSEPLMVSWAEGGPVFANSEPVHSPAKTRFDSNSWVAISRRVAGEAFEKNARALAPAQLIPCASIATRLALAAVGRIDIGYTLKIYLSPWDFAGGAALLHGAGGVALTESAKPIDWSLGTPAELRGRAARQPEPRSRSGGGSTTQ
jgi:myo-inositol-1(or 4)-monophosphatase